ncbi:MAG: TolC family protein [Sideroxydans sp.]|nr:TolC family protein [Sideroxydans sp.]
MNQSLFDLPQLRFIHALLGVCTVALSPCSAHSELILDHHLSTPSQPGVTWQAPQALAVTEPALVLKSSAPLSLAELTDLALRNSPLTREAWAMANAQAAAVGVAEADYWPTVDANVALTRGKTSINSSTGVISGNMQTRLSPNISLSYTLFDFGARSSSVDAARYSLLAANLNQNRTLQSVAFQVEQAYYQLLAAQQTVAAGEQTIKAVQLSVDAVNARRKAGLATIGNVYQAETLLAQSKLQLRQAQGAASKFKGVLCNVVGLPITTPLELVPLDTQLPTQQVRLTVEQYLAQAKSARPDLSAAEAQARAAHASIDAASAQGYPSLDLTLSGGKTYNNFQLGGPYNGSTSSSLGINLRVPLFSGFRTANTVRQAQARAEQLDANRDQAVHQVELEVWQAYYDLDTAEAAISSARALMRSAAQSREVAEARYKAGVGNLPDLLSAFATEANSKMEVIQAEMGWYSSLSRLNNAIGSFASESTPQ